MNFLRRIFNCNDETEQEKILRIVAQEHLRLAYIWGGNDSIKGFDCSGFVQELYASIGIDPPGDQTAQKLFDYFYNEDSKRDLFKEPRIGSLAFYGRQLNRISHVAMFMDSSHVIEAGGGNASTTNVEASIRQNAYIRIRPFSQRRDLVAILRPLLLLDRP